MSMSAGNPRAPPLESRFSDGAGVALASISRFAFEVQVLRWKLD